MTKETSNLALQHQQNKTVESNKFAVHLLRKSVVTDKWKTFTLTQILRQETKSWLTEKANRA